MNGAATRHWVVIPAAGMGKRMRQDRPKQYLRLHGKTILEHTLTCFLPRADIAGVVVAVSDEDSYWPELGIHAHQKIIRAPGGGERHESVFHGLRVLREHAAEQDWVLVHDAVRPCLRKEDLDKLIAELSGQPGGGLLACRVRDTLKRADSQGQVLHTENRDGLWHALTPQMFRFAALRDALAAVVEKGGTVTDEAMAAEQAGIPVRLVEGRADNIKVTHPDDLLLAERMLKPL